MAQTENRATVTFETVPVASLHNDENNARTHSAESLASLKESLLRFGQQKPIVVSADGTVIAGNGTFRAAVELGWKNIAVARSSLQGAEARAFAIADNRLAELSTWDMDVLREQLREIEAFDPAAIDATGFEASLAELEDPEPPVVILNGENGLRKTTEEYEATPTKQLVFLYTLNEYTAVVRKLESEAHARGLRTHAEALFAMCSEKM